MLCRRHIDIAIHPVIFYIQQWESRPYFHDLTFKCRALSKEASTATFKVFGMPWPGIEPTPSRTPGELSATGPPCAVLRVSEKSVDSNSVWRVGLAVSKKGGRQSGDMAMLKLPVYSHWPAPSGK